MLLMTIAASTVNRGRRVAPASGGGGSTALSTLAASMSAGQWAQMSPTPTGLNLFSFQSGSTGYIVAFATKIARDPINKKLYFIGCDHGAQTLFMGYDEASNAWTEQAASVPWGVEAGDTTSHGYEHSVFDHVRQKLWHRPYGTNTLRRWDGGTTWGSVSYSNPLFYQEAAVGVAWFPDMGTNGRIVVYQLENGTNAGVVSIDPVTNAVTFHADGSSTPPVLSGTGGPHCFCTYLESKACVVFGGGNSSRTLWKMDALGNITALDSIPLAITNTVGPANPGALPFYNPANGKLSVIDSASVWYECNPDASPGAQWASKGSTATILSANTENSSAYGVAAVPIPEYGGVAFVKNYSVSANAQMWFWKAS